MITEFHGIMTTVAQAEKTARTGTKSPDSKLSGFTLQKSGRRFERAEPGRVRLAPSQPQAGKVTLRDASARDRLSLWQSEDAISTVSGQGGGHIEPRKGIMGLSKSQDIFCHSHSKVLATCIVNQTQKAIQVLKIYIQNTRKKGKPQGTSS